MKKLKILRWIDYSAYLMLSDYLYHGQAHEIIESVCVDDIIIHLILYSCPKNDYNFEIN